MPLSSVAVQVTVVVPTEKVVGASLVIVGLESAMSDAVAEPIATGVLVPVASTLTSAGAVIDGDVVSTTVTF